MSIKQKMIVEQYKNKAEALQALEDFDKVNNSLYNEYIRTYTDVKPMSNKKVEVTVVIQYQVNC